MTNPTNLEAWAMLQGYDPRHDYVGDLPLQPLPDDMLSPHFSVAEFACNHCGELPDDKRPPAALLTALERIRAHYGVPININSGYRCPVHNANVGGASNSLHMQGCAADFWMKGISPHQVYADIDPHWPNGGLGKYDTFTHIDARGYHARWDG